MAAAKPSHFERLLPWPARRAALVAAAALDLVLRGLDGSWPTIGEWTIAGLASALVLQTAWRAQDRARIRRAVQAAPPEATGPIAWRDPRTAGGLAAVLALAAAAPWTLGFLWVLAIAFAFSLALAPYGHHHDARGRLAVEAAERALAARGPLDAGGAALLNRLERAWGLAEVRRDVSPTGAAGALGRRSPQAWGR